MTESVPPLATLVTEPIGGSALTRAAIAGTAPRSWFVPIPDSPDGWTARAEAVAESVRGRDWYEPLAPAIAPRGAAQARLERVRREGGVLVTTGQQPGLFGGPMLTWVKAIAAIALADELEATTGIPTAPLFWAATDDADFAEARWTRVAVPGGAALLQIASEPPAGTPMSDVPLGDLSDALRVFERACGSAAHLDVVEAVRECYADGATVGSAYVALLRRVLEPLGMAVLDASHRCLRDAARPILARALASGDRVAAALAERSRELEAAGYSPQVQEVAGLSLVFAYENGLKRRLPLREADAIDPATPLGATVLVRPVLERALLPTVAYCGGPGEIAYFAQVTAVAQALALPEPLVVPRWSATVIEPHVQRLLDRLGATREELREPHALESRLARSALPERIAIDLANARDGVERALAALEIDDTDGLVPSAAVQGARRAMLHTLSRLERRYVAAVKRRDTAMMHDVATAAGALYPEGRRQERVLNFLPMLARQGEPLLDAMRAEARRHARTLLGPAAAQRTGQGAPAVAP